jgi:prolipoprotein diacylglyceryltransferase
MLTMATITHSTQNKKLAFIMGKFFRTLNGNIKSSTKRNTNQLTQPQNDLSIFFFLLLVYFKSNPIRKGWFSEIFITQVSLVRNQYRF